MSTLQIDVTTDAQAAAAELESLSSAARGAGDAVATAGGQASAAGSNFDGLADGSDNVASKSSQAAGALGDLGGGLEMIGLTGAGAALEGVGMGAQVAAGAGDAMNLVADTTIGKFVLQTGAAIAHKGAMIAGAAASGIMAGAQAALNAIMSLNPVMLVVIAIGLLIGGLILAYNKSESFRKIVDGAFSKAKEVVEAASDAVQAIIGWFGDLPGKAEAAWNSVKNAVSGAISGAQSKVSEFINGIGPAVQGIVDTIVGKFNSMFIEPIGTAKTKVSEFINGIGPAVSGAVSSVAGFFASMFKPVQDAIGWVEDLIYKMTHLPSVDLNPFNRAATGGKPTAGGDPTTVGGSGPSTLIQITIQGAIDPIATARQIRDVLGRYDVAFASA